VTVVWLQGGPSTGKSSIARELVKRGRLEEAWFHTGDDHIIGRLPAPLITASDVPANSSWPGWLLEVRDGSLVGRPRVGGVALRILDGLYRGVAAMAGVGNNVVLDDVVWDPSVLRVAVNAMRNTPALIVEARCDLNIAQDRERQRTDRIEGAVRMYASQPPTVSCVDLVLDTTRLQAAECADQILDRSRVGPSGHAMAELAAKIDG
jgi:chloramphenicol 3-O phosphotransferase